MNAGHWFKADQQPILFSTIFTVFMYENLFSFRAVWYITRLVIKSPLKGIVLSSSSERWALQADLVHAGCEAAECDSPGWAAT